MKLTKPSGIQTEQPSRLIGQVSSNVGLAQGERRMGLVRQVNDGQSLSFHQHEYFADGGDDLREPNQRATHSGINNYLHHLVPEPADDINAVISLVKNRERVTKPLRAQIQENFRATASPFQAARKAVHQDLNQLAFTAKAPFEQLTPSLPSEIHVQIADRLSSSFVYKGQVPQPIESKSVVHTQISDASSH